MVRGEYEDQGKNKKFKTSISIVAIMCCFEDLVERG